MEESPIEIRLATPEDVGIIARQLMETLMEWAGSAGVDSLVLHAAPDGRPLYETLGFTQTNEMRYQRDISTWTRQKPGK